MNNLIKLEEVAKLCLAYAMTLYLGFEWWLFFAWLLAPDLSMIGYAVNSKVGAGIYNLAHHQGIAVAFIITGTVMLNPVISFAGWLLFGHSAMDRAFGYGLKFTDHFKHTHLGWIGKKVGSN
ncbi:MAG: DUF4260 domain-containing protein [Candidatus Cyclobacteriaceae bacterium M2_1C_046]